VAKTTWTDADGNFKFDDLLPSDIGGYTVTEDTSSPDWWASTDTSFIHKLGPEEDYTGLPFGNLKYSSISGAKFYDADTNTKWEGTEPAIEGWKVHLTGEDIKGHPVDQYAFTGSDGTFKFEHLLPSGTDGYTVTEVLPPPPPTWLATTSESFDCELGIETDATVDDFGNVCLKPGQGGLTLGYWSNKNGQALITFGDIGVLNGLNLYKPGWAYPPFRTKDQIRTYLLSANAVDMRWMLSAQLIATELDVGHGFLIAFTIVYVGPSPYVPSGFISIGDIMGNANTALSGTDRAEQEYWKNLLDGVNNNRLPFVCPAPCSIVYP
jgi:hypothetical protein